MRLAMAKISRRRADQFRDLMRVLELRAIDLDAGMGVAEQRLGHGFYDASLSRAGRPKKKQVAHGTPGSVQAREKHLVNLGDLFDGLVLTDDAAAQCSFKLSSICAAAVRIEHCSKIRSHKVASFLSQAVSSAFFLADSPGLVSSRLPTVPRLTKFVIWNQSLA